MIGLCSLLHSCAVRLSQRRELRNQFYWRNTAFWQQHYEPLSTDGIIRFYLSTISGSSTKKVYKE